MTDHTDNSRKSGKFIGRPIADRFWEKVDRRGPDECWNWIAYMHPMSRPAIFFNGKQRRAARVSWFLAHGGFPPDSLFVCHSCDNGRCVNPAHLWLGTHTDNIRDAVKKGRMAAQNGKHIKGSEHPSAKLTEAAVKDIRCKLSQGFSVAAIARMHGVARQTVSNVKHGKKWVHVS